MRRLLTASVLCALLFAGLACGGLDADSADPGVDADPPPPDAEEVAVTSAYPPLSDEDRAGEALEVGARVRATRSKMRSPLSATFLQQYGKIAQLRFSDANTGWVLVKSIEPPGAIPAHPSEDDRCDAAVGDVVMAPWSTSYSKFKGRIDETYGRMAYIVFDDGELDWADCAALDEVPAPAPAGGVSGGGGGGAAAEAIAKCQRGCNKRCSGASNKSKCVGQCRRACRG